MHALAYPLERGYINRWLLSDVAEEEIRFPMIDTYNVDVWTQVGVAEWVEARRAGFAEKRRTAGPPAISAEEVYAGASVEWGDFTKTLSLYFPFGDQRVNLSAYWPLPCHVSAFATTILDCPEDIETEFQLETHGGVCLYLNGRLLLDWCPFAKQHPQTTAFPIRLSKGKNRLDAWFDQFTETGTSFFFSLKCTTDIPVTQQLPIGNRDPAAIQQAEHALQSLFFSRNQYTDGDLVLRCDNPMTDAPFEVDFTGATEQNWRTNHLFYHKAVFAPHRNRTFFAKCSSLPAGFLHLRADVAASGVTITRWLTIENVPPSHFPRSCPDIGDRKTQAMEHLARHGEYNTIRATALLHTGGTPGEIEEILRGQIEYINRRGDCSDFQLIFLFHILRVFPGQLSRGLVVSIERCILDFRYWADEPGGDSMWFFNEHHALMFHTCRLLAGELYPDRTFTNSGKTGEEMECRALSDLKQWFEMFFHHGLSDWTSAAFLSIISQGLGCLYSESRNEEIRGLARRGLDEVFRLLAICSKDGYLLTTAGRTYLKELIGGHSNCVTMMSYIGYGVGNLTHAGKGALPLCFGDYAPPEKYTRYLTIPEAGALVYQVSQGVEKNSRLYFYKTNGYVMSSVVTYRPSKLVHQEHPFHLAFSPKAQLWINHPEEYAVYCTGHTSYWTGNGSAPQVSQYKGFACVVYNIPENNPVEFTHLYMPTMEFYSCRMQGNWIMGLIDRCYCAIYAANGLETVSSSCNTDREFISPGRKSLWIIRAASPREFANFDEFVLSMKTSPPIIHRENLQFTMEDPVYGKLSGGWGQKLHRNSVPILYEEVDNIGEMVLEKIADNLIKP